MLNFGARRVRASRRLGLPDIPYFIDHTVDSFDQVIENEQRDGLKPMELALFIKARMVEGMQQKEIAARLGKSKALVSQATALIDAPDFLMNAYRSARLRGLTEAYELRRLHSQYPEAVEQWALSQPEILRSGIAELRERLGAASMQTAADPAVAQTANAKPTKAGLPLGVKTPDAPAPATATPVPAAGQTAKPAPAAPVVMAEYKKQPLVLDVSAVPPTPGHFYGRRPGSPRRLTVPAEEVKLLGFAPQ
jgi:ParB family chromosome partitioning protein